MWVNGKASSGYNVLIAKGPKTAGHFEIYLKDGQMYFFAPDLGDYSMNFNLNTLEDGWHQLAFVWKSGYITVYADGKAVGGCTAKGTVKDTVEVMAFGGQTDGSMAFGGLLDTVRLYDRLLTDEELTAGADHESAYAKAEGNDIGKAFKTDFGFGNGTTVNMWFNAEGMAESFGILLAKGTKATDRHFEIYTERGMLSFYAPAANNGNALSLGIDLKSYVGGWHMLTVVHNEGKLEVYIDGVHLKSIGADFSLAAGGDAYYYGRLVEGGFDFPGKITEGELLDEVLTPEQIKARFESHLVIPEPEGGIKVETPLITLLPGESTELGITAYGATQLKLTTVGDAATVRDGKVTAEKVGETLIYAVSEDGRYIGGAVVLVVESIPEDTTEPDTDPVVEPDTEPTDTETHPVDTPPVTEAPDEPDGTATEPADTDPPKKGCRSSVGVSATLLLTLCGCWLALSKKQKH